MAGSLTKVGIGKDDCTIQGDELYPGTFSRQGSLAVLTGLTKMPDLWLTHNATINARAYNDGALDEVTILAACVDIGTTDKKELYLEPGTWVLSDNLDLSSYTNIFLHIAPGALLQPAASKTITVPSPENIIASTAQQIIDSTNNSTNPLKFSNPGTFPVNWWGVNDEAAQMAITEFGRVPGCHMKFVGDHTWNSAVKLAYANDSQTMSKVSGWGANITSTVNGSFCLEFESGGYTVKLLVVNGLHFECCGNETGTMLFDADSNCTKFFFNVTINNVFSNEFGGNGIEFEGCFFESRIYNCDLRGHATNTSGAGIYFDGSTQVQTSMSIYECTTRGCGYGIYAVGTKETYINGGTYILADKEGLYLNAARNTVINAHCEDNCVGGVAEAGMSFGGSGTIVGFRQQADTNDQFYGINIVPAAEAATGTGTVHVIGGEWDQTVHADNKTVAFIKTSASADTHLILDGNQTVKHTGGNVSISRNFSYVDYTDVSTSGTGEDDLMSYTVGPYLFPLRSAMKITANGSITDGNNGDKSIKLHVGLFEVTVLPAADVATGNWILEALLVVNDVTNIDIVWRFTSEAAVTQGNDSSNDQDISASFDIKLTGECTDAADDITQSNMIIKYQ